MSDSAGEIPNRTMYFLMNSRYSLWRVVGSAAAEHFFNLSSDAKLIASPPPERSMSSVEPSQNSETTVRNRSVAGVQHGMDVIELIRPFRLANWMQRRSPC